VWDRIGEAERECCHRNTETLKKLMMLMMVVIMTVKLTAWIGYSAALCIFWARRKELFNDAVCYRDIVASVVMSRWMIVCEVRLIDSSAASSKASFPGSRI